MDGRNLSPKIESPLKEVTFFWPWHFGFGACIIFYLKKEANLMKKPVNTDLFLHRTISIITI